MENSQGNRRLFRARRKTFFYPRFEVTKSADKSLDQLWIAPRVPPSFSARTLNQTSLKLALNFSFIPIAFLPFWRLTAETKGLLTTD